MAVRPDELAAALCVPAHAESTFPPTAFVHMPRDTHTAAAVASNVAALLAARVPAMSFGCDRLRVDDGFFTRIGGAIIGGGDERGEQ